MPDERFEVLDLGLRSVFDELQDRALELAPGEAGRTVFVAGEEGSGRTELLQRFVAASSSGRSAPVLLSGSFESGEYVSRNVLPERLRNTVPLAESVLTATSPLHPLLGLAAQLATASKAAQQALETLAGKSKREHPLALVPRLLRRIARNDGPVVCVIDEADRSSQAWWGDLMLTLSREVALDLPLLLVFGIEGPEELGPHQPDEPPGLFVARQLRDDGLADWRPIASRTTDQLAEWIGPANHAIPRMIGEITAGRAGWTAELWQEWRDDGIVRRSGDGWCFAQDEIEAALSPANQLFGRRLQNALGEEGLHRLVDTHRLLAHAALEGRHFTADSLALALGQDPDEIIDFLDDKLSIDAHGDIGIVEECPTLTVSDESGLRHLRRYKFRAELDWLALRHYGFPDAEKRQEAASAIAEAMLSTYGAAAEVIALAAVELFEVAGEKENARNTRRGHNVMTDRDTALLRARLTLRVSEAASDAERNRGAEVLIAGARALYNSGPWQEGLRFCERAVRITNVLPIESSALYYAAWFRFHLEDQRGAREYLERALAGAEKVGSPDGIADCLHQIANVDLAERRFQEAEEGYRRVLEIRESRRDHEAQARVHEAIGDVNLNKEDYPGAIAEYEIAARIAEEIGDRLSWANTRYRIARIQYQEGDVETCRLVLRDVVKVQREFGDRRDEIVALTLLSDAEYSAENVEGAHAAAARALELTREIGGRHEAGLLHRLATADWAQERAGRARSGYESAIAKAEGDGQLDAAVTSGIALGCLELESGNRKAAKVKLKAALKVAMSIGARAQIGEIQGLLAELS